MIKLLKKLFAKPKQYRVIKTWNFNAISREHAENRSKYSAPDSVIVIRIP